MFEWSYNTRSVIPGRAERASPESITTIVSMDSGLVASRRPGMTWRGQSISERHCEERSDEAIQNLCIGLWIASLRSQ